ncbi:MAG: endonuclease/exonuclease/phosphatase family protein [Salaquimonas sp.]
MKLKTVSFTTFNLLNLNEPNLPIYTNDGWSEAVYNKKIAWTAECLKTMKADVFGFQELWHNKSLKNAFSAAGLDNDYTLLIPNGHNGKKIVCAGAVRSDILVGQPEWISEFPDSVRLESKGDDPQTPSIKVAIKKFSRPVLHFRVKPREDVEDVHVYVCHFKSKGPTKIFKEKWYNENKNKYQDHTESLGYSLSTIRRTAEAAALKVLITKQTKKTDIPVVVLGDVNDGIDSNTMNVLTGQPSYLTGFSLGGGDADLYTAQVLQNYRSQRDVYYTHEFNKMRESLDQILVSQEFYDNSKKRIWEFDGLTVKNDHLNFDDHKTSGTNDHGIVRASFKFRPAKKIATS